MGEGVRILSKRNLKKFRFSSHLGNLTLAIAISSLVVIATAVFVFYRFVVPNQVQQFATDRATIIALSAQYWVVLKESNAEELKSFESFLLLKENLLIREQTLDELEQSMDDMDSELNLQPIFKHGDFARRFEQALENNLGHEVRILQDEETRLWVQIPFEQSEPITVAFYVGSPPVQTLYWGLVFLIGGVIVVLIATVYTFRRISRPLTRVVKAAESFRGLSGFKPLPEQGAYEMVSLAKSFNKMAEEITTLIENRTAISAGLSHDLKTPLTRMRLALELLPEDIDPKFKQKFEDNIDRMTTLITDAALFAKGQTEPDQKVNPKNLISSTVRTIDENIQIEWQGKLPNAVQLAPSALDRCVTNLVQNARLHATGVSLKVRATANELYVHVVDDGPGIPPEDRQRVLQPYVRLDKSRSTKTGGSGLGLAVVVQLCLFHQWKFELHASETGGTDAVLIIELDKISKSWTN